MRIEIKILQTDCCSSDHFVRQRLESVAAQVNVKINVTQTSNLREIMQYGPATLPAIVIDHEVYHLEQFKGDEELADLLASRAGGAA